MSSETNWLIEAFERARRETRTWPQWKLKLHRLLPENFYEEDPEETLP